MLKEKLMKLQEDLPVKAESIENKILEKNNITMDEYFNYVNENALVQAKIMKLNN